MRLPQWAVRALLASCSVCLGLLGMGAGALDKADQHAAIAMIPIIVTRVLDATTLQAQVDQGDAETIRLLGIAAVACYEQPALIRFTQLAKGRRALLELPDESRDRSGRLYGFVWIGARLLNEQLVAEGMAMPLDVQSAASHSDELKAAANRARDGGLGLWSQCGPADGEPDAVNDNDDGDGDEVAPSSNPGGPRRVSPISTWECPATHPVKATITDAGDWVYTRPNQRRGPRIKPLDCFATVSDALQAGYHFIGD